MEPDELWGASDYAPTALRLAPVAQVIMQTLAERVPAPSAVVEIGAGHGQLATLLADRGYDVTAIEPSSRMREIGAARTPAGVAWVDARAEDTGLSADFDAVVSSFGLMFADPSAGVREAARLLRPGGTLIMTGWAPRGFLHDMTTRMVAILPYLAGAPHLAWGDPDVARERLGAHFDQITTEERTLPWGFPSVDAGMELYRAGSPTHTASFAMAGDRRAELEAELERHLRENAGADGSIAATANYLLIRGSRR